ncbi:single-stranded DNA-binding protein [Candidatus Peregrinibacteria bacterium]|nr:single-stranded DNA-binding protein [Candidatus Peregrinibacteria bacterium]
MRSMNKAMLIGRLAADPEKRITTSGKNVCFFPIAINRDWKSSDGQKSQTTDYHRVVSWQKLAEICGKHLRKGMGVYVEGRLMNRAFNGKDGEKKYMTEIVLENLNILDWLDDKTGEKDVVLKDLVED